MCSGEYADYYTKDFKPATSPVYIDMFEVNDDYACINNDQRKALESKLPKYEVLIKEYKECLQEAQEIVNSLFSQNSITLRFEGMLDTYKQLEKLSRDSWNCSESVISVVQANRQYILPVWLTGLPHLQPYHVELYIKFASIFYGILLVESRLKEVKVLLNNVNANLPFAEMCETVPAIQNVFAPTNIGDDVRIGTQTAVGSTAKVEVSNGCKDRKRD